MANYKIFQQRLRARSRIQLRGGRKKIAAAVPAIEIIATKTDVPAVKLVLGAREHDAVVAAEKFSLVLPRPTLRKARGDAAERIAVIVGQGGGKLGRVKLKKGEMDQLITELPDSGRAHLELEMESHGPGVFRIVGQGGGKIKPRPQPKRTYAGSGGGTRRTIVGGGRGKIGKGRGRYGN